MYSFLKEVPRSNEVSFDKYGAHSNECITANLNPFNAPSANLVLGAIFLSIFVIKAQINFKCDI